MKKSTDFNNFFLLIKILFKLLAPFRLLLNSVNGLFEGDLGFFMSLEQIEPNFAKASSVVSYISL